MEVKEQLAQMLSDLKKDFLNKYVVFTGKDNFDSDAFIQQTVRFFKGLEIFHKKFIVSDGIAVSESFVNKCEEKIKELSTDIPAEFQDKLNTLIAFLNGFLLMPTQGNMAAAAVIPHPLNQDIVENVLRPQPDLVDAKKMEIINSGTPIDEEAFKKHNDQLFFSRSLYRQQLLTNVMEASRKDKSDCSKANQGIEDATADTFFDKLDAARAVLDSKIVPVIA